MLADLLTGLSGGVVGLVLGLVGGGGSILAVPLMVYVIGVGSPHVAIGTSAVAVSASAVANLAAAWRQGRVKWRCGLVFAAAGSVGALAGSSVAKTIDGQKLLLAFGLLMIVVAALMFLRRGDEGDATVRLERHTARRLLPWLTGVGFATGLFAGFFGIGGGFLVVPGLVAATGMPLLQAAGTSLVAVTVFGATTAASYAASGLVDWRITGLFVLGGLIGGLAGRALGGLATRHKGALGTLFAVLTALVGTFLVYRGVIVL